MPVNVSGPPVEADHFKLSHTVHSSNQHISESKNSSTRFDKDQQLPFCIEINMLKFKGELSTRF